MIELVWIMILVVKEKIYITLKIRTGSYVQEQYTWYTSIYHPKKNDKSIHTNSKTMIN